jgi:Mn2+/Fe2+ NRAMP family transporter
VHDKVLAEARSQHIANQGKQSLTALTPALSSLALALEGTTSGVMPKVINNHSSSSIDNDSNIERPRQRRQQQRRQKQKQRKQLAATTTTTTIASTIMTKTTSP